MAEDCMDVRQLSEEKLNFEENKNLNEADFILEYLIKCEDVFFKSQQRGEDDLCTKEKKEIATNILLKSKGNFLSRFGKHLTQEHLNYFQKYTDDATEGYDIQFYLNNLKRNFSKNTKNKDIKNRRYNALTKLIDANSYFTETEMMRRNPLLYDQLVGQYLSDEEKKKRDNIDTTNITFVNLLLESIDRDWVKMKQKQQQQDEDNAMEEEDSSDSEREIAEDSYDDLSFESEPCTSKKWGEFEDISPNRATCTRQFNLLPKLSNRTDITANNKDMLMITATERRLLKDEFISIMYQHFLDGKDVDFDYTTVDDNEDYDNLNIKTHDAEDEYFDSELPEDGAIEDVKMVSENETSEDELDIFMNRLNQQETIKQLSQNMSNL